MMSDEDKRAMGEALLAQLGRSPHTPDAKDGDDEPPPRTGLETGVAPLSLGYFDKSKPGGVADVLARLIGKDKT